MALSDVFVFLCAENVHANKNNTYLCDVHAGRPVTAHGRKPLPGVDDDRQRHAPYPYLNLFLS